MKRILTIVTAILLALVTLVACAAPAKQFLGAIKDGVYTCDFAELTFTAPKGWYITQPVYKLRSFFWSDGFPLDMRAFDTAAGSDVAVAYADLASTGKTDCDEAEYFDLMKEKAVSINQNTDFNFGDYTDVKVGPNSFTSMHVSYKDSSDTYNAYYYIRREGSYMICISVQIPENGDIETVIANFS